MTERFLLPLLILFVLLWSNQFALAKWGTVTVTDDNGEEIVVKHGLFGKKTIVKDRFGNGVESKKSIFGLTKDTEVNAVGNDVHVHKGLFGFSKTEGHDILGDTVTSKKNLLYSNTNVNLSGVNDLLNKYLRPKNLNPQGFDPNATNRRPMNPGLINQTPTNQKLMNRDPLNQGLMNQAPMSSAPINQGLVSPGQFESTPHANPLSEANPNPLPQTNTQN